MKKINIFLIIVVLQMSQIFAMQKNADSLVDQCINILVRNINSFELNVDGTPNFGDCPENITDKILSKIIINPDNLALCVKWAKKSKYKFTKEQKSQIDESRKQISKTAEEIVGKITLECANNHSKIIDLVLNIKDPSVRFKVASLFLNCFNRIGKNYLSSNIKIALGIKLSLVENDEDRIIAIISVVAKKNAEFGYWYGR